MKKLFIILLLWLPMSLTFAQIEFPKIFNKGDGIKLPKIKTAQKSFSEVLQKFDKKRPISTNFDDAIYEVELLSNFEPLESEYRPLDIQPSTEDGGFRLTSGVYTMTARSFCLRAGTYGPSRGDGHLYAPLKGKQADFVQEILGRYAKHPEIKQQNIQVLLWAIVAGADMNTMDAKYMETLSKLFTPSELLKYKGKDWLNGMFGKELDKLKQQLTGKIAPQLQKIIEADAKIRTTLTQNKTYQEIESIAILAGVAPAEDMIREVSKGRWSYHPNGFFVRYFPRGYKEARIDVYVPFEGSVSLNSQGSVTAI